MNSSVLQRGIDEVLETSRQQWLLRAVAVAAAVAATLAATAASGEPWPIGVFAIAFLSGAAAVRPDTHTALVVVAVIVYRWLESVDGADTAWLPVAGVCLLVFHAAIALAASLPTGGNLPSAVLAGWCRRTAIGGGITVAMWVIVAVLDERDAAGNGFLTGLSLAIVAAGAVLIRARSIDHP